MNFIKKVFSKKQEELSPEEVEQLNDHFEQENETEQKQLITVEEFVNNLKLDQLNKVRNLVDAREEELTGVHPHKQEESKEEKKEESPVEEIEEYISSDEVEEEPQKKEDIKKEETIDEQFYDDISEEELIGTQEETEDKTLETPQEEYVAIGEENFVCDETELFVQEVKKLFGEENVLITKQKSSIDIIKGKESLHIGIRKQDGFLHQDNKEESNWFISTIKQLKELKNFKMIASDNTQKQLIWFEEREIPIIIHFKTTSVLENDKEFNFN